MGIFGGTNKKVEEQSGPTIISEGTHFIGGLSTTGIVHINGQFEGVILQADLIVVGKNGKFVGDIKSTNVVVSGFIDGKIDCDVIQILDEAHVVGEIRYKELIIEKKGKFEGKGIRKESKIVSQYHQVENKINSILGDSNDKMKKIEN